MNIRSLLLLLLTALLLGSCTQPSVPAPTTTATDNVMPTSAPTEPIKPTATADGLPDSGASTLLHNAAGQNADWNGIGRLYGSSSCTASFIATSPDDAAPAYVLTNGHCIEWLANGVVMLPDYEGEVVFNYFVDTQDSHITVPISSVAYSTMQGVDVAVVELDATVGELTAQGLQPLQLADAPLADGSDVFVIGAPSSGVAQDEAFLRQENCRLSGRVDVLEFQWHFNQAYRTDCQDIFGGSSGSPLFAATNTTISALINTTVEGESLCYLGVPCEISTSGVILDQSSSYATPVDGLARCFDNTGRFALTDDCPLPPVTQLTLDGQPLAASQPPLSWNTTLSGTLAYYRYKTGRAGEVDCRSAEGYSPPIALADTDLIDDAIPDAEGFYLLCVQAGESATVDATWLPLEHPTVAIAEIDTTPPTLAPQVFVRDMDDARQVDLIFQPPELSDYIFKFGKPDTTDCTNEADYQRYRRIPPIIENDELPAKLCVIGFDNAGNPTEPLEQLVK